MQQCVANCSEHTFKISHYFRIGETDHPITLRLKPGRSLGIARFVACVSIPVKPDDEFDRSTDQVGDVGGQ